MNAEMYRLVGNMNKAESYYDQSMEISFEINSLPEVEVTRPDQTSFVLRAQFRETFYEPFTGTTSLRLADHLEEAQQGEYSFLISGKEAGRYVVSIGTLERFGTEVQIGEVDIPNEDKKALDRAVSDARAIREAFNFHMVDIKPGSELTFLRDENDSAGYGRILSRKAK